MLRNCSRERIALLICVPITVISVTVCCIILFGNGRSKITSAEESSDTVNTDFYINFDDSGLDVADDDEIKTDLEYQSLGNGSCLVMGIGSSRSSELVIPEKNPRGERVIGIGNRAFENCRSIVSVSIPASVVNIGSGVFRGCSSLVIISVDSENEKYSSSGGILYSKDKTRLICCPPARIGSNYLLNPNVRIIDDYAFEGIKNIARVMYEKGTADFEQISIGAGNEEFLSLPITCNYSPSK